jgi:hypothetical protein
MKPEIRRLRKLGFWIALILISCGILEMSSAVLLYILLQKKQLAYRPILSSSISENNQQILKQMLNAKDSYLVYSSVLGWTIRPNARSQNSLYTSDARGLRTTKAPIAHSTGWPTRIAAFGDSFTFGEEVANSETWMERLHDLLPGIEALNFGVGGYGLDQAFLRYQTEGAQFHPNIVFIGFMSENINRSVNVFRPFYYPETGIPMAKPRFILQNEKLLLRPNPLSSKRDYEALLKEDPDIWRKLQVDDYFFPLRPYAGRFDFLRSVRLIKLGRSVLKEKYSGNSIYAHGKYNVDSEAFHITCRIMDEFYRMAIENQSTPMILLFPDADDLRTSWSGGITSYHALATDLKSKKYRVVDLIEAFEPARQTDLKDLCGAHYSPLGNNLVALHIHKYLQKQFLIRD